MNYPQAMNLSLVLGLVSSLVMVLNQEYSLVLANIKLSWVMAYVICSSSFGLLLWFKSKSSQSNKQIQVMALYFNVGAIAYLLIGNWFFGILLLLACSGGLKFGATNET